MTEKQRIEKEIGDWVIEGLMRYHEVNSIIVSRAFNKKISTVNVLIVEYAKRKGLGLKSSNVKLSRKIEKSHHLPHARMKEFLEANINFLIGSKNKYNSLFILKQLSCDPKKMYYAKDGSNSFVIPDKNICFTFSKTEHENDKMVSLNRETEYKIFEEIIKFIKNGEMSPLEK